MSEYLWRKTMSYEEQLAAGIGAVVTEDIDGETGGAACLEMAEAYLQDGRHFIDRNDLPNALAAFAYGHGWLDAGVRLDLLGVSDSDPFTIQ